MRTNREKMIRLAMRGFLGCRGIPKSASAKKRLAAEFLEFVGTMNQSDREDAPADKYSRDEWLDAESASTEHGWKEDARDEVGFGIPRTAAKKKKAIQATKLAFLTLGEDSSDSEIERQARTYMVMPYKSIVATMKRIKSAVDEEGCHEGEELDDLSDIAEHEDDEDEIESIDEAEDGLDDELSEDEDEDEDLTADEDDELKLLYEDESPKSAKSRTASLKKLGRVTVEDSGSGDPEVANLSKLWKTAPKVDWNAVDEGLFDEG